MDRQRYERLKGSEEPMFSSKYLATVLGLAAILTLASVALVYVVTLEGEEAGMPFITSYVSYCARTRFREECMEAFSDPAAAAGEEEFLLSAAVRLALNRVNGIHSNAKSLHAASVGVDSNSLRMEAAMRDCVELQGESADMLSRSGEKMHEWGRIRPEVEQIWDVQTWLSASLTYQTSCSDGMETLVHSSESERLMHRVEHASNLIDIALSFVSSIYPQIQPEEPTKVLLQHRLLSHQFLHNAYPYDTPDLTVALDGSADYTSIMSAVYASPFKSKSSFVIYIKAGIYYEYVEVPKNRTNLVFVGDGIGITVITGNKSVQDPGVTTFTSHTVAVLGEGFLARDITIRNTAGAINHQAVALRVGADKSAFFRCSFEGYQDTLYAHSLRQFYRECAISGTVDFIFGNAAALFQSSTLLARKPMANQQNLYTAQGRTSPDQNTGFSFQSCTVDGTQELKNHKDSFPTYLGRPWKEYSRTVYLSCYESSVVNPAGWLPWDGDFALSTLYYGEYLCQGPGSSTSSRVSWSTQLTNGDAGKFTASSFIDGSSWLNISSFPFDLNL